MRLSRRGEFDLLSASAALAFHAWLIAPARVEVERKVHWLLFDDPMISMRYAANLARGAGLAWNPGEAPVEGYSNPLWTLMMAALHMALPGELVALAVIVIGALLMLANGFGCRRLAMHAGAGEAGGRVALLAGFFCMPLAFWTLRGFEVGLASALYAWGAWLALGGGASWRWRRVTLGAVMALLVLTRADGAVLAGALWIAAGVFAERGQRVRLLMMLALWPAAALIATTAARLWYYGDLLPNTYYLKMTGGPLLTRVGRGWTVLWSTLDATHFFAMGLAVVALAMRREPARLRDALFFLWAIGAAYSAFAGGDAWEQFRIPNRYLSTTLVPLIALAAIGIDGLAGRARGRWTLALACIAVAGAGVLTWALIDGARDHASLLDLRTANYGYWSVRIFGIAFVFGACAWAATRDGARFDAPMRLSIRAGLLVVLTLSLGANMLLKRASGLMPYIEQETHLVRLAKVLELHTQPDARIGVTWAGVLPYELPRACVDLLGKCDREIARLPHGENPLWVPGHSKWDVASSVKRGRPDLLLDGEWMHDAEEEFLRANGYARIDKYSWILRASPRVSEELLAAPDLKDPTLDVLLRTRPTFRAPGDSAPPAQTLPAQAASRP